MLGQRLAEHVLFGLRIEHVEVVVGVRRGQGRLDRRQARVGNGRGGQSLVEVEVVGAVQGGVILLGDGPSGGVDQRGVDLKQASGFPSVLQTVVDDRGDVAPVGAVGLPFDQGGDGDDLLEAVGGFRDQIVQLLVGVNLVLEVFQHGAEGQLRPRAHIKFIRVREQVALQAVGVAQAVVVDEGVALKLVVGGGIRQVLHGAHLLFRQKVDDLLHRVALGDRDLHGFRLASGGAHIPDQGHVVHLRVEHKGALRRFGVRVAEPGEQAEEPFILDQSRLLQRSGQLFHVVMDDLLGGAVLLLFLNHLGDKVLRHLEADLLEGLVQRGEVVGQHPAHRREDGGGGPHDDQPKQEGQQGIGAFLFLLFAFPAISGGTGAFLPGGAGRLVLSGAGLAACLPGYLAAVPAGGFIAVVLVHGAISSLRIIFDGGLQSGAGPEKGGPLVRPADFFPIFPKIFSGQASFCLMPA